MKMRKSLLSSVAAGALALGAMGNVTLHDNSVEFGLSKAAGQVVPPPPPPPPPGGGGDATPQQQGNGSDAGLEFGVNIATGIIGNVMVSQTPQQHRTRHRVLWNVGHFVGAFANPAGAVIGGAGLLAAFGEPTGFITRTLSPEGWKCNLKVVYLVAGCEQWLKQHGSKAQKKALMSMRVDTNALIALDRVANRQ